MVKLGEFSPLNPDLQCTGRALLGLGEYEEKRRILLEKKKHEYLEQMAQARAWRKTAAATGSRLRGRGYQGSAVSLSDAAAQDVRLEDRSVTDVQSENQTSHLSAFDRQFDFSAEGASLPFVSTVQEMNRQELPAVDLSLPPLSPGAISISARDRKLADLQQSFSETLSPLSPRNEGMAALSRRTQDLYQEELRQQIEEKRRLEAEQKERERREEEAIMRRLAKQQEQMQREYEREEAQRKALAERRAQQMEEVLRRREELEREAVESRKKTKRKLEKQRESYDGIADPKSLSVLDARVESVGTPVDAIKYGRRKASSNEHPVAGSVGMAVSTACTGQFRNAAGGEGTTHFKLYGVEKHHPKDVSTYKHRGMKHSPPTREHQQPDQKEKNSSEQSRRGRVPLKMLDNLGRDQNLEDTLPIPVFRCRSPVVPAVRHRASLQHLPHSPVSRRYSEGMQILESKWQVPAVQKNHLQTTDRFQQARHNNELTQLGAFRRQMQLEQMRLDEMLQQQQGVKKA